MGFDDIHSFRTVCTISAEKHSRGISADLLRIGHRRGSIYPKHFMCFTPDGSEYKFRKFDTPQGILQEYNTIHACTEIRQYAILFVHLVDFKSKNQTNHPSTVKLETGNSDSP